MNTEQLKSAGFSDAEIQKYVSSQTALLSNAGFMPDEIDDYFGTRLTLRDPFEEAPDEIEGVSLYRDFTPDPYLDPEPTELEQQYISAGYEPPAREYLEQGQPQEVSLPEAFKMGRAGSIAGKLIGLEQEQFEEKPTWKQRAALGAGRLSHDLPLYMIGSALGGGGVLGMAGAFALPEGIHKVLDDKEKDEMGEKFVGAMKATGKGWLTGLATGWAGKLAPKGLKFPAEVGTMTTASALMDKRLPQKEDLIDAFILLGMMRGATNSGRIIDKGLTDLGLNKKGAYNKLHSEMSDHIHKTNSFDMSKAESDYLAEVFIKKSAGDTSVENLTMRDLWKGIKVVREQVKEGKVEPPEKRPWVAPEKLPAGEEGLTQLPEGQGFAFGDPTKAFPVVPSGKLKGPEIPVSKQTKLPPSAVESPLQLPLAQGFELVGKPTGKEQIQGAVIRKRILSPGVYGTQKGTPFKSEAIAKLSIPSTAKILGVLPEKLNATKTPEGWGLTATEPAIPPADMLKPPETPPPAPVPEKPIPEVGLKEKVAPEPIVEAEKPLIEEAKKYKSAEEFVEGQNKISEEALKKREAVKKNWFTTTNPKEALYIMDDGSLIDGTGKAQAGKQHWKYMNERIVDHREIASNIMESGGSQGMNDFMVETKAIRMSVVGDNLNIDIIFPPTPKQWVSIKKVATGKTIIADISNGKNMENLANGEFKTFNKYKEFVDNHFKESKAQLTDIWNKAQEGKPKPTEPLIAEAKKYKTAEEFVEGQGKTLYHGTTKEFAEFEVQSKAGTEKQITEQPIFFSTNKKFATKEGKADLKGGRIVEASISKDAKIWDFDNFKSDKDSGFYEYENYLTENGFNAGDAYDFAKNIMRGDWDAIESIEFKTFLKSKGYDGFVEYESGIKNIGMFDAKFIKTKSQLTDIWNKAQVEGKADLTEEAKGKTLEEFVGGEFIETYHGTRAEVPFEAFDYKKGKSTWGKPQKAYFFSSNKRLSPRAASVEIVPEKGIVDFPERILTFYIRPGNVFKPGELLSRGDMFKKETPEPIKKILKRIRKTWGDQWVGDPRRENVVIKAAKEAGYDSIEVLNFEDGWETIHIIFDSKNIKTKSQLTDIWNKAQVEGKADLTEEAKGKTLEEFVEGRATSPEQIKASDQLEQFLKTDTERTASDVYRKANDDAVKKAAQEVKEKGAISTQTEAEMKRTAELAKHPPIPEKVYRGINLEELNSIKNNQYVKSTGRGNFDYENEKGVTLYSGSPHSAEAYADGFSMKGYEPTPKSPTYVIELKATPDMVRDSVNYIATNKKVSIDNVNRVIEIRPTTEGRRVYREFSSIEDALSGNEKYIKTKSQLTDIWNKAQVEGEIFIRPPTKIRKTTTLYSGIDPTQIVANLKGLTKNIKEAMPQLESLGRKAYGEGAKTFGSWQKSMKSYLGNLWDSFKKHMLEVWRRTVRAYKESKLGEERGSVSERTVKEKRAVVEKNLLIPVKNNALDQAAVKYRETGKIQDYFDKLPTLAWAGKVEIKPGEVFRYDPASKQVIATYLTPSGVSKPAIRQSGFHVPVEFVKGMAGKKDVHKLDPMWTSPSYLIQKADAGMIGNEDMPTVGLLQKHVLWPTRSTEIATFRYADKNKKKFADTLEKYNIHSGKKRKAVTDISELVTSDLSNLSIKNFPKATLSQIKLRLAKFSPKERTQITYTAQFMRKMYDRLLKEMNTARRLLGRKEIPYRKNYVQHIAEMNVSANFIGLGKQVKSFMQKAEMPDFIKPNAPHNPRELARKWGIEDALREKDIVKLGSQYIETAARDIFFTNIIHNNKIYSAVLRGLELEHIAKGIEDWTAESFGGVSPTITKIARATIPQPIHKGALAIRRNLTRAVFPLNWTWNVFVQTSSAGVTFARCGTKNCIKGLEYFVPGPVRDMVQNQAYSHIVKQRHGGTLMYQDLGNSLLKMKHLDSSPIETAEHFMNYLTRQIEQGLTGWSVAAGLAKGKEKKLTGRALLEFASDEGAKSQSFYHLSGVPGLLRAKEVGALSPFQTFAFEMWSNAREMNIPVLNKLIGKTGLYETINANSVEGKALLSKRLMMIGRWIAAMVVTNMVTDKAINRKVWSFPSSFIPFWGVLLGGPLTGMKSGSRNLTTPQQYVAEFYKGTHNAIKDGNFRGLRNFVLRYHVLAGIQAARVLDGIDAVAKGEVTDVLGRRKYEVEGLVESIRAITMGPSRTEAGIEYFKKKYPSNVEKAREYIGIELMGRKGGAPAWHGRKTTGFKKSFNKSF